MYCYSALCGTCFCTVILPYLYLFLYCYSALSVPVILLLFCPMWYLFLYRYSALCGTCFCTVILPFCFVFCASLSENWKLPRKPWGKPEIKIYYFILYHFIFYIREGNLFSFFIGFFALFFHYRFLCCIRVYKPVDMSAKNVMFTNLI